METNKKNKKLAIVLSVVAVLIICLIVAIVAGNKNKTNVKTGVSTSSTTQKLESSTTKDFIVESSTELATELETTPTSTTKNNKENNSTTKKSNVNSNKNTTAKDNGSKTTTKKSNVPNTTQKPVTTTQKSKKYMFKRGQVPPRIVYTYEEVNAYCGYSELGNIMEGWEYDGDGNWVTLGIKAKNDGSISISGGGLGDPNNFFDKISNDSDFMFNELIPAMDKAGINYHSNDFVYVYVYYNK